MTQELEIHVPISPTEHFFTMVQYFAASLRLNGGKLAGSRIVVMVGADQEPEDLRKRLPWSRRYPIQWRWLDRGLFRAHGYYATAVERFRSPFEARAVMLADADMLVVRPFDDLVDGVLQSPAIAGLVAHVSPFWRIPEPPPEAWWSKIFTTAGLPEPKLACEHTGWGVMEEASRSQYCPPYFNLGMLLAPREIMSRLGEVIYAEMEAVNRVLETIYRCQIAVSLALARTGVPWRTAPFRYNFPNIQPIAEHRRADLDDMRILHYLRPGSFDKAKDFRTIRSVQDFLKRRDVSGVDAMFQQRLAEVHRQVVRDLPRRFGLFRVYS